MDDEVEEMDRDCIMDTSYAKARLSTLFESRRKLFHLNLSKQTKRKLKQKTHRGLIVKCQALVNWGKHFCEIIF